MSDGYEKQQKQIDPHDRTQAISVLKSILTCRDDVLEDVLERAGIGSVSLSDYTTYNDDSNFFSSSLLGDSEHSERVGVVSASPRTPQNVPVMSTGSSSRSMASGFAAIPNTTHSTNTPDLRPFSSSFSLPPQSTRPDFMSVPADYVFREFVEAEPNSRTQENAFQSIGFQFNLQRFSHEEVRLADYQRGKTYTTSSGSQSTLITNTLPAVQFPATPPQAQPPVTPNLVSDSVYKSVLAKIIFSASMKRGTFPSKDGAVSSIGLFNFGDLSSALGEPGPDHDAFDMPFGNRKDNQLVHDMKIGATGELYVCIIIISTNSQLLTESAGI